MSTFWVVLLPAPLGPRNPKISCDSTAKERPRTAGRWVTRIREAERMNVDDRHVAETLTAMRRGVTAGRRRTRDHVARALNSRDAMSASGAATKLRSAPIFVSASADPAGNAAVAKNRDTVKPIDAVMPTTTKSARRRPCGRPAPANRADPRTAGSRSACRTAARQARSTCPAQSARTGRRHSPGQKAAA